MLTGKGVLGGRLDARVVDREPAVVWRYIVDPELRTRWLGMSVGGEVRREEGRLYVHGWEHDQPGPSTVTWTLEPLADGRTKVMLRHDGIRLGAFDYYLGWHDFLIALAVTAGRPLIRQTRWIDADPEKVWPFLSTQVGMRAWWSANPGMRYGAEVGGEVEFRDHGTTLTGRIVEFVPEKRIAFTFEEQGALWSNTMSSPTIVAIDLLPEGGGTRVTITHFGFEGARADLMNEIYEDFQRGWADSYELDRLERVFAEREPEPANARLP